MCFTGRDIFKAVWRVQGQTKTRFTMPVVFCFFVDLQVCDGLLRGSEEPVHNVIIRGCGIQFVLFALQFGEFALQAGLPKLSSEFLSHFSIYHFDGDQLL